MEYNELKINFPKGDEDSLCEFLFSLTKKYTKALAECENKLSNAESQIERLKGENGTLGQQLDAVRSEKAELEKSNTEALKNIKTELATSNTDKTYYKKALDDANEKINDLTNQLNTTVQNLDKKNGELTKCENKLSNTESQIERLRGENSTLGQQLDAVQSEKAELEKSNTETLENIKTELATSNTDKTRYKKALDDANKKINDLTSQLNTTVQNLDKKNNELTNAQK